MNEIYHCRYLFMQEIPLNKLNEKVRPAYQKEICLLDGESECPIGFVARAFRLKASGTAIVAIALNRPAQLVER
jgi:hypothetical protein